MAMAPGRMVLLTVLALTVVAGGTKDNAAAMTMKSSAFADAAYAYPVPSATDTSTTPSFAEAAYQVTWPTAADTPTTPSFADVAYQVTWPSAADTSTTPSFAEAAYQMTWPSATDTPNTPSFAEEAYQVTWPTTADTSTTPSFAEAAYQVTWPSTADTPTTPSFAGVAYPVRWPSAADTSTAPSFAKAAYQMTWPSADDTSTTTSFAEMTYQVTWPSAADTPTTPSFANAYPVKWPSDADTPTSSSTNAAIPDHVSSADKDTSPAHEHGLHVETGMLFLRKDLHPGAVLPEGTKLGVRHGSPGTTPRFLSKKDADAIPFAYSQRDDILKMFRIPHGSKKAKQVGDTLRTCGEYAPPEPHTCATSRQAMLDFATEALRTGDLRALLTVLRGEESAAATRYVVASFEMVGTTKAAAAVACHPMPYPYMVYFCHRPSDVEVLRVQLTRRGHDGADAGGATAVAMCHSNTTNWDVRFFNMLNATRGEEICHYMPGRYITWMSANTV